LTSNRRLLAGAFALAVVLAACGGSGSKSAAPTAAATDNGNGGANPTEQPTEKPTEQGGTKPTEAPLSFEPGTATELEKLIPSKIGTIEITKTSLDFGGIPWAAFGGGNGSSMEEILKANGKTLADVKFAVGMGTTSGSSGLPTMIYAMQVKGLDAAKFVEAVDGGYADAPELAIGGKKPHGNINGGFGTVTYLHDDIVFQVIAAEADLNEIMAALP
jgi:hypothetical protein